MYQNFYYSIFIWSSTCFRRYNAHHQEPKTALAASGFSYVEGCWTCSWWTLSGCARQSPPTTRLTTFHAWKTRGCQCSFRLLMMGAVSPETCWASYEYGIIKILIYCCTLLDFSLWIVLWCMDVVRHSAPDNVHQLHVQQPSTYEKPEADSAVLGSWWWEVCRPKHAKLQINME